MLYPLNILLIVSCLENLLSYDHKVRITSNGLDALNTFKVTHYDVVITDIELPKMNGIELLKAIWERDKRAYVIILTGNSSKKHESDAKKYGSYAFSTLPYDIAVIGTFVSFISGWISLVFLMRIVRRGKIGYFGFYCLAVALGGVVL